MQLLEKAEFVNVNKDKVVITLFQDGAGGFHLIVKSSRMRKTEEIRFPNGKVMALPMSTWTEETRLIPISDKAVALNEFHLYRVLESEPGFTSADYSAWQAQQKEEI